MTKNSRKLLISFIHTAVFGDVDVVMIIRFEWNMFQVISCSFLVLWINSFAGFDRFERWGHFGGRILGPATFQWTLISEITDSDSDQQEIKITVLSGQTSAFFEFSRVFLGPKGRRSVYNIKVYATTLRPQKYFVYWHRSIVPNGIPAPYG